MSPTVRAGLLFGVASVAAFVASFFIPIPFINVILAFGSVVALGWGAGYTAAKTSGALQGQGSGRGAVAGALAGVVNLILFALALTLLLSIIARIPSIQTTFQRVLSQAQTQNPNVDTRNLPPLGALLGIGGAFLGFCLGLINLLLMVIASLVGGAMWKGSPNLAGMPNGQYMPSTGYTMGNQPLGSQPSATGYPPQAGGIPSGQSEDTGARIYPDGDQR